MTPEEVAAVYLRQAELLENFIEKVKTSEFSEEQYKLMLLMICERYYELLHNLATFTPLLQAYKVKFYNLGTIENKMNLEEPPFEKEFFNKNF
jgi:hypothetical protein